MNITKGPAEDDIRSVCVEIADMLCAKNRAYGNSALEPLRIFSKTSPIEQILVRIDDKLSRLARGEAAGEDVELDLIGYLVLLRVARRRSRATAQHDEHLREEEKVRALAEIEAAFSVGSHPLR